MQLDRQTYLGGSDAAAILGVSPWRTPLEVYEAKVNGEKEIDEAKRLFFKRRKRQEPIIAEILTEEYGLDIVRLSTDEDQNRLIDPEYSFLAAEIDFEFRINDAARDQFPVLAVLERGTLCNGEIKTVHPFKAHEWGEEGSEEIPVYYTAQTTHGLSVTRRPACLTAALFGVDSVKCFPQLRDEETIAWLRHMEVIFWTQHVLAGIPPDPTSMDDVTRVLEKIDGYPVELSPKGAEALFSLQAARSEQKRLKDEEAAHALTVALEVCQAWQVPKPESTDDNAVLRYEGVDVGSWKRQRGAYLDQKRLKAEHPDISARLMKEHFFRVMRAKNRK